jgi:hypothetical protein
MMLFNESEPCYFYDWVKMKALTFPLILLLSLILTACEFPLPSSNQNSDGQAGSGFWVCLNQDSANNAVIKKFGFDGREKLTLPRYQQAFDVALADANGSVWTSQLGIDGNYRILKYSDSGEELLRFEQQDAGFFFIAQSLAPNLYDGSCWFVSFAGIQSHVCRIGSGGGLLADNSEFDTPVEVIAAADGTCWVLDRSAMLVARLDGNGNRMFNRGLEGHIPRSLAVDPMDGACWVGYDSIIVKYNPLGEVLLEKELEYQIHKIAVHPTNHSICIQIGLDLVDEYDGIGNFGWRFYTGGNITDMEITDGNGIWITNGEQHGIYRISDSGVQESAFAFTFAPSALAIYESNDQ